jgi:hypothetical protein
MKVTNFLMVGALSLAAWSATAGTVTLIDGGSGGTPSFLNGTDGSGGAFIIQNVAGYNGEYGGNGVTGDRFATFCLETDEFITLPGGPYTSFISNAAVDGGTGGPSPDPISEATSLLYYTFRTGGLIAGDTIDTSDEVSALQYAIWALEQETFSAVNGSIGTLSTLYAAWATSNAVTGNFYNVRVLNLSTGSTLNQSMLTLVPLPTAAWMGLGLLASAAGVSYARRRSIAA